MRLRQAEINALLPLKTGQLMRSLAELEAGASDKTNRWTEALARAVEKCESSAPDLPHQDAASHELLDGLLERVESVCLKLNIKPLDGTVVGTLMERSLNAFNASFFGTTSLIVFHQSVFVFVLLLAKCIVPMFVKIESDGTLAFGAEPPADQLDAAVGRLTELIRAMRDYRDPYRAPPYLLRASEPLFALTYSVMGTIELFICAHEYGHLVIEHSDDRFLPASVLPTDPNGIETSADMFAYLIVMGDATERTQTISPMCPLMFFKVLALMERDGVAPVTSEHPSSANRLTHLLQLLDGLTAETDRNTGARALLKLWDTLENRIDTGWALAMNHLASQS